MASIDHLGSGQPINLTKSNQNKSPTRAGSPATPQTIPDKNVDEFSLSDQSRAIGAMNQKMATEPHFDTAKVEQIKAAIADGSYTINADKLAENMLKHQADFNVK